jgi:hypothetical protein
MPRATRALVVFATIATAVACETVEDPFPPQTSLDFDITDSSTATQLAPLPAPQIVNWRVEAMSASNVTGVSGTYSFLYSGPCSYQQNALANVPFTASCRTSGLSLQSTSALHSATLSITLSRLELRAAARPDLTSTADPDGDGIPNVSDNCPIVYNPDQANVNAGQELTDVGDACSDLDSTGSPTIPDQDVDGIPDRTDNCLWYANPLPTGETSPPDSDRDGIGDACERTAPVAFVNGPVTVQCDNVTFNTAPSGYALFRMDFGRPGVLTCDAGFTGCTLNPNALKVSRGITTQTFPCHQVP